jgi:multidrug efflux pump subunit AcrB
LIPKIYDTERIARIIGEDGETKMAKINPEQAEPVKEIRDMANPDIVIEKIYNPSVGKYDVVASTGPGYATKRQEALEAMAQLLQGNPDLWKVAGDLFVKNMDWPGAQEMAKRFAKTIDPKIMEDGNKSPELQAAEQQIQAMGAEMEQMHKMLQNVNQSVEVQEQKRKDFESQVKAYDAETKRIQAVQAGMSPEQIQDIVLGTVHGMITSGDLVAEMPGHDMDIGPEMPQEGMEQQPVMPQGMPQ